MDNTDSIITDAAISKPKKHLWDFAEMQAEWIGHVTCQEERRRAEEWAKVMGTGYPSSSAKATHKYVEHRTYTGSGCAMCGRSEDHHTPLSASLKDSGVSIDNRYQNPSSEPKGEQVEPRRTGDAESAQDKQD